MRGEGYIKGTAAHWQSESSWLRHQNSTIVYIMAPCNTKTLDHQAASGLRKLRKPVIEKMRRDRINSSIEQLRMLLEREFQKHQLPSKPEKADILEMTVTFLQQHMAGRNMTTSSQAHGEGYSRCVQDSVDFLSAQNHHQDKLMRHLSGPAAPYKLSTLMSTTLPVPGQLSENKSKSLWRPW